jgi:hypothetical protein
MRFPAQINSTEINSKGSVYDCDITGRPYYIADHLERARRTVCSPKSLLRDRSQPSSPSRLAVDHWLIPQFLGGR